VVATQTLTAQITRVSLTVLPADISADLTRDPAGTFSGTVSLPVGAQTVTASAWAGITLAGTGAASVSVIKGQTAQLQITVLDATGPAPLPDHSPVVTSLAASATAVALGDHVSLVATALDADGDAITFAWSAAPAGCGTFETPGSASTTCTAAVVGTCAITLTASARGQSDSRSTSILVSPPASGGPTPKLVQHVSSSADEQNGPTGNDFKFTLPNPVLAGNCLILGLSYAWSATRTVSVGDDNRNAWPASPAVTTDDGATVNSSIFVLPNANAGATTITVHFDALLTTFQYTVSEFNNIATVTPINGSAGQAAAVSANKISTGSFTPGNNDANGGNLIWAYFANDSTPFATVPTTYAAGGSFSLLDASIGTNSAQLPHGAEYFVQTAAAAIDPSMTLTGGGADTWNGVAVALKAASAGNAPAAGIRIVSLVHETNSAPPTTWVAQFPSQGNLSVVRTNGDAELTSITDSNGNTYTRSVADPQIWHADNVTPGLDLKVTLTYSAPPANRTMLLFDIKGAATEPEDGSAQPPGGIAPTTAGPYDLTDSPIITPVSPGLTIAGLQMGIGPVDGFAAGAPAGAIYDFVYHTNDGDGDRMDSGDGAAHFYNSDLTPEHWNWHIPNVDGASSASIFSRSAVHFKAAPTGGASK
jgi:hypothetical protein